MGTWTCTGFRPIDAQGPREAADIFGQRLARRKLGSRGRCVAARLDFRREDGKAWSFEVTIGIPVAPPTGGYDVTREWLTVCPVTPRFRPGDRVEGGKPGTEDFDRGVVRGTRPGAARVGWDSGVETWTPLDLLRREA